MLFTFWLRNWKRLAPAARRRTPTSAHQQFRFRPRLEACEDRCLPSGLPYPTAATVSQLIADINYADQTGGAFTINLQPSATFDVKSVNNTTDGANGLPVVGGTKAVDLTILGNGDTIERAISTSSGHGKKQDNSPAFRLFEVAAGASLTLDHVTLKQGSAAGTGGAIYNLGTLTISNGIFSNNSGGDIYNAGGTATVSYSTLPSISNNGGTVTVSHCTLPGGGVTNQSGTMTLSDSAVSGGRGIYNAGTLMVNTSTISNNSATYGGGIYNAGTLTVSNTTISGNEASLGGGIYNHGTATLSGCTITGNYAYRIVGCTSQEQQSGGIFNDGTLTIKDSSQVTRNPYSELGDDVYNLGMVYLDTTSTIGILDGNPPILI